MAFIRRWFKGDKQREYMPDEFYDPENVNKLLPDKDANCPTKAWNIRKNIVQSKLISPISPSTPISEDHVRFVCVSDTHSKVEDVASGFTVPDGDVLLHTGDFSMSGLPDEIHKFNEYLGTLPHKVKVVIAGNHDLTLDTDFIKNTRSSWMWSLNESNFEDRLKVYGVEETLALLTNCIYLQDDLIEVFGINIYGTPWHPRSGCWGFTLPRGAPLVDVWNDVPKGVDILLTHCPPAGYGDQVGNVFKKWVLHRVEGQENVGCVDLLNTIQHRVKPRYHVYGHVHEGYGVRTDGTTTFVNASICTALYKPTNPAIVFDLPLPAGHTKEEAVKWITLAEVTESEDRSESDAENQQEGGDECTHAELGIATVSTENPHQSGQEFYSITDEMYKYIAFIPRWFRGETRREYMPDEFYDPENVNKLLPDKDAHCPTKAWNIRKNSVQSKLISPISPSTSISEDHVRFVCVSDTHSKVEDVASGFTVPDGDVLLHTGDFSMSGLPDEIHKFNEYLGTLPHKVKVVIAGNHDLTLDTDFIKKTRSSWLWSLNESNFEDRLKVYGVEETLALLTNCIYLQDDLIEVFGINIYGTPWHPRSGCWGFNLPRGAPLVDVWNDVPKGVDILLTHCPPAGYGDLEGNVFKKWLFNRVAGQGNVGCVDLLNTIQHRVKPRYHVYGHVHKGYGVRTDGTTTFVNASICTPLYKPTNPAIVFDLPLPAGHTKEEAVKWITQGRQH